MNNSSNSDNSNSSNTPYVLSSNSVIRLLEPVIIPRVSAIACMGFCERAAFNISFFGMESSHYTANGEIGNAVHRITIKSVLEIIDLSKRGVPIRKDTGIRIFEDNTEQDITTNWKRFMLVGVENPLVPIREDLEIRADRLLDKLIDEEEENKLLLFRPEFTIRNIKIPLEGRLDPVKIKLEAPPRSSQNFKYTNSTELQGLEKERIEIIQLKTGKSKTPPATWKLQADAETLLLMET
ncbi:MAG TPA: hypothetical protein VE130_15790, partial [Nitrososphaeraceae archaeon]|nr:hypothetical protein [Nitrososphaeraceae archaeon]